MKPLIIRGIEYESFEHFENDLEANPLPICFDPHEELKQFNLRHLKLQREWNDAEKTQEDNK